VSRNAHLNVRRLGAICRVYLPDAYGEMKDVVNANLPSDRFQTEWWVTSNRVRARLESSRPPLDLAHYLSAGVPQLNSASLGPDDLPRPAESPLPAEGSLALVEIPADFASLKARDSGLALAWRNHSRHVFESAFAGGYLVTDFIHLKGERLPRSFYLLSKGEGTLG
jgi:predicted GNAT superfamily acetyltransferase